MYLPTHFEIHQQQEIVSFIEAHSFGQLISIVDKQLYSSHLPFYFGDNQETLFCHVAKQNPQWQSIESQQVLVTFQGPHDYISPSWYHKLGVPTWNYQAVHVYGDCELLTEAEQIRPIIEHLTAQHESQFEKSWAIQYPESMLQAIVGIQITITDIQAKYKLSQNRGEQEMKSIVEHLQQNDSSELAQTMLDQLE